MLRLEIAHPDRRDPPLVAQVRERLEGFDERVVGGRRPVDQVQVEAIDAEPIETGVKRGQCVVVSLVGIPQFGDQEDILAGNAGLGDCPAGLDLVAVDEGGAICR